MKVIIKNKTYTVKEAKTPEEKRKGLQGVDNLPEDEGILFYFDPNETASMWMKDCEIPLDIIFIDDDLEVMYVYKGEPNSEQLVTVPDTAYVLELNQDSGVKEGDEIEFEEDSVMKVLFPDGSTQMELWGGERIFRRAFTKQLIDWCKRAREVKANEDQFESICKRIGKKMFKELDAQDNRPPEYVQNKNAE